MNEQPLFLGVDPGILQHGVALVLSNGEVLTNTWGDFQLLRGSTWSVDYYYRLIREQHRERLVVVIEWPVYQGRPRGGKAFAAVLKQAARVLHDFELGGAPRIYTPPAEVVRRNVMGHAHPSDSEITAWCAKQGLATGRGTQLNSNHKRDALLAALWGRWLRGQPKEKHNDWIEPRK